MTAVVDTTTARRCKACQGTGKVVDIFDQTVDCWTCEGQGSCPAPDIAALATLMVGRKGLRQSPPNKGATGTLAERRAYYVWRIARFDSGQDMSMPIMATVLLGDDPFKVELDATAEAVAKALTGSGRRGAERWHQALYGR